MQIKFKKSMPLWAPTFTSIVFNAVARQEIIYQRVKLIEGNPVNSDECSNNDSTTIPLV